MGPSLLGGFGAGILLRVPVGFALAGASILTLVLLTDVPLAVGAQRIVAGITPFPLLAIPLFVLAGSLMNVGGITRRLLDLADALVGRLRGGLAQTNIVSSLMFGGLSGSAVADVSSLGRILIPAMKERNYRGSFAAVVTASSAIISPILPPSITLILFGVVTGTSIGQLFFAGIVPAILYVLVLMVTVHVSVRRIGFTREAVAAAASPKDIGKRPPGETRAVMPAFVKALPALFLPVLILGGIRGGIFTPTEAAAVAVVYSLLVGIFVYRELSVSQLRHALLDSTALVGVIMLVLAAAQLYSWALTTGRVPQMAADALFAVTDNAVLLLLLINVLLLIVGMFVEANAALLILTPILLPVATAIGIDPIHLGMIVVINLGLGLITPPVGLTLLLSGEIAGISSVEAIKAVVPFLAVGIGFLMLITYVPAISLWLPSVLY